MCQDIKGSWLGLEYDKIRHARVEYDEIGSMICTIVDGMRQGKRPSTKYALCLYCVMWLENASSLRVPFPRATYLWRCPRAHS